VTVAIVLVAGAIRLMTKPKLEPAAASAAPVSVQTPGAQPSVRPPPQEQSLTPIPELSSAIAPASEGVPSVQVPASAIKPSVANPTVTSRPARPAATPVKPAAESPSRSRATPLHAEPNCNPNYYIDGEGQKRFKPECFSSPSR
jgi:hypothetical protein